MYEDSKNVLTLQNSFATEEEVENLVQQFETCTLPASLWTHHAHLVVALRYLLQYSEEEAIRQIRQGIVQFNVAVGGKNTDHSGYHETITLFYIYALHNFLKDQPEPSSWGSLIHNLLNSKYADKSFLYEYYSKELLMSVKARKAWVEPDLKKIRD